MTSSYILYARLALNFGIFTMTTLFQPLEDGPVVEVTLPSCRRDWGRDRNISTPEITRWPSREAAWAEVPSQCWPSPLERNTPPLTVSRPGRVPSFKVSQGCLIVINQNNIAINIRNQHSWSTSRTSRGTTPAKPCHGQTTVINVSINERIPLF